MTENNQSFPIIFTDGACIGNPGPGGYAAVIMTGDDERVITGGDPQTTNNRMELMAAIKALEALPIGASAILHSDSEYVIKGISSWIISWKAKGTAQKKPVKNDDLWQRLDALDAERRITWKWVRGHAGHEQNERVDGLANAEAMKAAEEIGWAEGARYGFQIVAD